MQCQPVFCNRRSEKNSTMLRSKLVRNIIVALLNFSSFTVVGQCLHVQLSAFCFATVHEGARLCRRFSRLAHVYACIRMQVCICLLAPKQICLLYRLWQETHEV